MIQHVNARWFDLDCLVVIVWSLYFLNALQSDNNSKRVYVQVLGLFWALIPKTHFNPRLAARAKMRMTRAQNIFMPKNMNSIALMKNRPLSVCKWSFHTITKIPAFLNILYKTRIPLSHTFYDKTTDIFKGISGSSV